jgi:uncharacterized protein (DUF302 family)
MPKQKARSNKDVYEKVEDLPEVRQKNYFSILEDFDKQGKYLLCKSNKNAVNTTVVYFEIIKVHYLWKL